LQLPCSLLPRARPIPYSLHLLAIAFIFLPSSGRRRPSIKGLSASSSKVQAGIVGYPNVGKSSLINCLLKRRMCLQPPNQELP
ncbi:hypothetical protein HN873_055430, partial [Arachis hypogaea]